ncbi:MAG: DNA-binding protein [Abditibacteriota bacterium]|nr:DNA-binding protein [Abditibacteriota bacterium]
MDYRRMNDTLYVRIDKGEEIISELLGICREENIGAAVFTGIGGCARAELQIFIPDKGTFETETIDGMLELINITGNIITGDDGLYHHTHATFSYMEGTEHKMKAGHMKSVTVRYTAEIELRPVIGGVINRTYDPETGTGFWRFDGN